jgi:Tfp pilus assembly protein PilF
VRKLSISAQKHGILALICIFTTLVFWQLTRCEYINFDDPVYVTNEPRIAEGLNLENLAWAFTSPHPAENWQPATTISYLLDVQVFGSRPFGHHVTNLLIHLGNTALLLLLLNWLTGFWWRSAIIAALFALHPMHVEAVAWISSRKDVLCTLFFMLSIWAYSCYARSRKSGRCEGVAHHPRSRVVWYLAALVFFAGALMSKAMAVTLPFVLLLLDYWPLGRMGSSELMGERALKGRDAKRQLRGILFLLREKIPFFVMTAVFSWLGSYLLRKEGATTNFGDLPLADRVANGIVSYARYIGKLVWPTDLSAFYPRPAHWPVWSVAFATLLIAGCSVLAFGVMRRRPYVFVGWFWFLGTMVPVAGIIYQIGGHSMADRHTYLPYTGLFILITFGLADLAKRESARRFLALGAAMIAVALGFVSRTEVQNWRNSETLFRHALSVDGHNDVAHELLGLALSQCGKTEEAELHFAEALRIKPDFRTGRINYAAALARNGKVDEGISQLLHLLKAYPDDPEGQYSLALILQQKGDVQGAVEHYKEALRLKPDDSDALNNLAWILAANRDGSVRNGQEAVRLAEQACAVTRYQKPLMIGTLAAAYAEAGRFKEAAATAKRAQETAIKSGQNEVAENNARLLEFYQAGKAYHD